MTFIFPSLGFFVCKMGVLVLIPGSAEGDFRRDGILLFSAWGLASAITVVAC